MAGRRALGAAVVLASMLLGGCGSATHGSAASDPLSAAAVRKVVSGAVVHTIGVQVTVALDGPVVFDRGYGKADVAAAEPVSTTTRFAIGSVTKQVTAALVLRLVADRNDAPLGPVLPGVDWPAGVTVKELLQQTSGPGDGLPPGRRGRQGPCRGRPLLAALPTAAPPGDRWIYENNNNLVAGDVVEATSGQSYLAAASAVPPGGGGCDGVATSYDATGGKPKPVTPIGFSVSFSAGGHCSTAKDLLAWQQKRVTGELGANVDQKLTAVFDQSEQKGSPYGMGLYVDNALAWHDGYLPSATDQAGAQTAYLAWLPNQKIGVAVLANTAGSGTGAP